MTFKYQLHQQNLKTHQSIFASLGYHIYSLQVKSPQAICMISCTLSSIFVFVQVANNRKYVCFFFYSQDDYHVSQEMRELHNKTILWSQRYITLSFELYGTASGELEMSRFSETGTL